MGAGNFEVTLELLEKYGEPAKIAKAQVDKLIDLAAPPPKGTGVSNIRECIIQDKMTFDVSADEWQAYLKEKIMNNIERYFYLIVFAMYIREVGPNDYNQTFKQWMDEHAALRDMIAEGRSKLEWERKIPEKNLWTSRPHWTLLTSRPTCQRSSRGSMSSPGNNFLICPEVIIRTTQCTSWLPRP